MGGVTISQEQACEVLSTHLGPADPRLRYRASSVPGTGLWRVTAYHGGEDAGPGAVPPVYFVGPDGTLWQFSADGEVHDVGVAVDVLAQLYAQGLARQVEPELFANRLAEVTEERVRLARSLLVDARSGRFKSQRRVLP